MKSAVGAISLALVASVASAQGGSGGAASQGGAGGQSGLMAPGVGGGAVLSPPPRGQVVAPGVTGAPGASLPADPSPTAVQPQPGVGQPNTTIPAQPTTGIQQPANGTQVGTGTGPSGSVQVPPGAPASPAPPAADTAAVQPPSPGAVVIAAPTSSEIAPIAGPATRVMPPDAVGVVVEGMMLAEVIALDTERGCITVRALDGDTASYRIVSPAEATVAVGEPVIIEIERPLIASANVAPSASPRMTEPNAAARVGPSPAVSSKKHDARAPGEGVETRTTISTAARAPVISRAVRCSTR